MTQLSFSRYSTEGVNTSTTVFGTGADAGADEDDFHTLKRRRAEVDRDERTEERVRKMANVKAGVHSGVVKAFGAETRTGIRARPTGVSTAAQKKKVVTF
jgi:hypothetical protein